MEKTNITIPLLGSPTVLLTITFFIAKIFDKINWDWIWVFSPLWIPLAVVSIIFGISVFLFLFISLIIYILEWKF